MLSDSIMASGGQHGEVLSSTEFYRPELDDWQPLGLFCKKNGARKVGATHADAALWPSTAAGEPVTGPKPASRWVLKASGFLARYGLS